MKDYVGIQIQRIGIASKYCGGALFTQRIKARLMETVREDWTKFIHKYKFLIYAEREKFCRRNSSLNTKLINN